MKGLLICRASDYGNLQTLFPDRHLWLLPVAGKPIIEYQLETLARMGIREIRLLCDISTEALEARLGKGERLGLELSYAPIQSRDQLGTVLRRNQAFINGDALVLIQGLAVVAPLHAPHCLKLAAAVRLNAGEDQTTLMLGLPALSQAELSEPGTYPNLPWIESRAISSLNIYYHENMGLMKRWQDRISWPGYGLEQGFQLGERVRLGPRLALRGTGLIAGRSVLAADVSLEDSLIGQEVLVGAGSTLRRSVVLDGTWIGPGLSLDERIVDGSSLIDPVTGTRIQLSEPGWLDQVACPARASWPERLLAAGLWLTLLPMYHLFNKSKIDKYQLPGAEISLPEASNSRLQLHLVPRFQAVMTGKLALVGQEPVPAGVQNPYPHYLPAALAYSSCQLSSNEQARLDDASYPLFSHPWRNLGLCLRYLSRSLLKANPLRSHLVVHER